MKDTVQETAYRLRALHDATTQFAKKSGIGCKPSCGACCTKAGTVWATIAEMLPMAWSFHMRGMAESMIDRLRSLPQDALCAVFEPLPGDGNGRCGEYSNRPSVCRLFGASGRRRKDGNTELLMCQWQRNVYRHKIESWEADNNTDGDIPMVHQWQFRLQEAIPAIHLNELFPINKALEAAIELTAWSAMTVSSLEARPEMFATVTVSNGPA